MWIRCITISVIFSNFPSCYRQTADELTTYFQLSKVCRLKVYFCNNLYDIVKLFCICNIQSMKIRSFNRSFVLEGNVKLAMKTDFWSLFHGPVRHKVNTVDVDHDFYHSSIFEC